MKAGAETGIRLDDRYVATSGRVQLTGIQALARLPIDQHRRDTEAGRRVGTFISGYEGSPLAGYDLELARLRELLTANDVTFVPGLNEEAAATAVQGSQLANTFDGATRDGVLGIWYGKAPGLDRATDAVRHGNLIGAHPRGGVLLLVGDDPAAKSSSVPSASEFALADLAVPFLYPADSGEILDLGLHAIELSRVCGLWAGLKIVTAVADGSSTVDLSLDRPSPLLPDGAKRHVPTAHLLQPRLGTLERDLVTTRLRLAREYSRLNGLNRVVGRGSADRIGVAAAGRTWLDLRAALEKLGIHDADLAASPVRLLKVGMPYPLDQATIHEFAEGLDEILIIEEKRSFLEAAIRDLLYGNTSAPMVTGKRDARGDELIPAYGELDVDAIAPRLDGRFVAHGISRGSHPDRLTSAPGRRTQLHLVKRAPYFCSGCPHNTSTKPLDGSLIGGGIGCHAMVLMMDESQVGKVTGLAQMGGEGLQWIGMAPFMERDHYVQNLGDGTFDHSGSLAIRAAVAAGVNITYKLLYNSAVAMTGGQRPSSGMGVRQIVDILLAEGVSRVIVTTEDRGRYKGLRLPRAVDVWDRSRIAEAQAVLATTSGVTVLLHDQECATEKRRKRKRGKVAVPDTRIFINERVCEGCGDCGRKSNCLSVQPVPTEFGRKTRIHQASCNVDYACLTGDCPAFMSVTVPSGLRSIASVAAPGLTADELPAPQRVAARDDVGVRLTGVGGTGVVTTSRILATAGLIAGWTARSLDQTGLAQKGGAVVSDVRFSRTAGTSNKLAAGECDLYLGCDILVAADAGNLNVTAPDRTVAVLSTAEVPTGHMVSDPSVPFPTAADTTARVRARVRDGHVLDARELTLGLFGDDQYANILMVGIGFQTGALPLPAQAIEEAITLNGATVESNLQAFRRGRQYVVDPAAVLAAAKIGSDSTVEPDAVPELERVLRIRVAELTTYQDAAYATRYTDAVEAVRRREAAVIPGSTRLAEAVACNLYKLMAYKDEYEVARLSLDSQVTADITRLFGADARVSWNLHPPVLRAMGMTKKLRLGAWFRPAFCVLYAMRRLRGTAFDPFGRARVRVVERSLVREYLEILDVFAHRLDEHMFDIAVEMAELPDMVRGYEEVKLRNVERYHERLAELRSQLDARPGSQGP
jgi:indolepyruvate ferredoxin oxidoreductase